MEINFLSQCQVFESQISQYVGSDPLDPYYKYILWLENEEKANAQEPCFRILENTLRRFEADQQYMQDPRFIHLILLHIRTKNDKLQFFSSLYEQKVGTSCAILYESWAAEFIKIDEYIAAFKVIQRGFQMDARPVNVLEKVREHLYCEVGRLVFSGQFDCKKFGINCSVTEKEGRHKVQENPVKNWVLCPLKVGEEDTFSCPVSHPDPPDPNKVCCYLKDLVYADQECQLEEVFANIYWANLKKSRNSKEEAQTGSALKTEESRDVASAGLHGKLLTQEAPISSLKHLNLAQGENNPVNSDMAAMKPFGYNLISERPSTLLPHFSIPGDASCSQSFTQHTKAALNVVQEMWTSPSGKEDAFVQPVGGRILVPNEGFKIPELPQTNPVLTNTPITTGKSSDGPLPFQCFKDNSVLLQQENASQARPSTGKRSSGKTGLSVRKIVPGSTEEDPGVARRGGPKHQLFEVNDDRMPVTDQDEILACRMDAPGVSSESVNIPKLAMGDWTEDLTCNTRAFTNLFIPASTPNMKGSKVNQPEVCSKPPEPLKDTPLSDASIYITDKGSTQDNQLSIILEASKERASNSGMNSSVASQPQSALTRGLDKVSEVEVDMEGLQLGSEVSPFSAEVRHSILAKSKFPAGQKNCFISKFTLPSLSNNTVKLGMLSYAIANEIGKGAYARVLKATCGEKQLALKIEKPACVWEFYIASEIRKRLGSENVKNFVYYNHVYIFKNGSILEMDLAKHGTLINVINKYKAGTGKNLDPELAALFTIEMFNIIEHLHYTCNIIHADIKPDNFLLRNFPDLENRGPFLELIDFGQSIDMKSLPPGTTFTQVVTTSGFQCNEMKENRPWTYQTDLYGLAASIYCVLRSEYMKLVKSKNVYVLQRPLPRNMINGVWDVIFNKLLNIESCSTIPNLVPLRKSVEGLLAKSDPFIMKRSVNILMNVLKNK